MRQKWRRMIPRCRALTIAMVELYWGFILSIMKRYWRILNGPVTWFDLLFFLNITWLQCGKQIRKEEGKQKGVGGKNVK